MKKTSTAHTTHKSVDGRKAASPGRPPRRRRDVRHTPMEASGHPPWRRRDVRHTHGGVQPSATEAAGRPPRRRRGALSDPLSDYIAPKNLRCERKCECTIRNQAQEVCTQTYQAETSNALLVGFMWRLGRLQSARGAPPGRPLPDHLVSCILYLVSCILCSYLVS